MIPPAPIKMYTAGNRKERQGSWRHYRSTVSVSLNSLPINTSVQFKISPEVGSNRTFIHLYAIVQCVSVRDGWPGKNIIYWSLTWHTVLYETEFYSQKHLNTKLSRIKYRGENPWWLLYLSYTKIFTIKKKKKKHKVRCTQQWYRGHIT